MTNRKTLPLPQNRNKSPDLRHFLAISELDYTAIHTEEKTHISQQKRRAYKESSTPPPNLIPVHDERIPPEFLTALLSLRDLPPLRGLSIEEVPAPHGLAPYTAALSLKTDAHDLDTPLAAGRFIILHDPHGIPEWNGTFRIVAHMRTRIEPEMSSDPLLAEALWHWAHDCLEDSGAGYHSLTGTVTREISESFGGLHLTDSLENVELRASWTPVTPYLGEHLHAWSTLLGRTSGALPTYA